MVGGCYAMLLAAALAAEPTTVLAPAGGLGSATAALAEALEGELLRLSPGLRGQGGPPPLAEICRQFALERMLQETREIYQGLWRN